MFSKRMTLIALIGVFAVTIVAGGSLVAYWDGMNRTDETGVR